MEPSQANVLKKTKFGTLFEKDTRDLFSSLVLSLKLTTHKQLGFKTYRNAFLGHEAIQSLASLKFIRAPDARDLSNLVALSKRTLKLSEESAAGIMQHFLDGSLIVDATTTKETLYFKKKTIYTLTFKGWAIVQEFVQNCDLGPEAGHITTIAKSLPAARRAIIRLERWHADDELLITGPIIANLFRNLLGPFPNYDFDDHPGVVLLPEDQRSKVLKDVLKKDARAFEGKISSMRTAHCIAAPRIINWICDNSNILSPREAAEVAAHFVGFGLIIWVADRAGKSDTVVTFKVAGPASSGAGTAEFRYCHRGVYVVTDQGGFIAGWLGVQPPQITFIQNLLSPTTTDQRCDEPSEGELANTEHDSEGRLKEIIGDPSSRALFRQFLVERRREHDLAFWLDVEDFKAGFEKAAKATPMPSTPPVASSSKSPIMPLLERDKLHESLGNLPFLIYNTYLAPSSECKLSPGIGHDLQEELQHSLERCLEDLTFKVSASESDAFKGINSAALDMDQLEILLWLYGRVQARVFAGLLVYASKFLKWPKYKALQMRSLTSVAEEDIHEIN